MVHQNTAFYHFFDVKLFAESIGNDLLDLPSIKFFKGVSCIGLKIHKAIVAG